MMREANTSYLPDKVHIHFDKYKAMLNLPIAFELLELPKIYALFKLIKRRPNQNEDACEILDQFFPAWTQSFFDTFTKAALRQWDAGDYAEVQVRETEKAKKALDRCRKIIKAYEASKPQKTQGLIGA